MTINLKDQLQHKIDLKTKPLGALGQLEAIALQLGMIQNTLSPELKNPSLLVFAADHGIADEGVSPYPKDVTWQMVMNFCSGGAAINVFCKQNGIGIKVIDAGVDYDFPADLPIVNAKIARGSRNMLKEPAMTVEECRLAMKRGAEFVQKEAEAGSNTIAFGEMGIGNTSPSSLLMHRFLNLPIEECTGKGAGMKGDKLDYKTTVLRTISKKYDPETTIETLATFGGLEIAMMVGAILEAHKQGMVILIDGFIATAATVTAIQFNESVRDNCLFCHASEERGHQLMLEYLHAKPVLSLGMRLGEGSGAAVAYPVIKAAATFLNEMASFEDAGVSNKE
ncbi:nicotinate-nucleotide--dimethylbenzimidazole phosphoribosyltransferase [Sunxiuqinia elliptica]|uniref:Nicotinate-nucleotide--dimethylbenzimidazole phosphoribosyltransferase n=1 Tax=Sunxiuqinia elliptica TaxID=655355 RepID=A0A4R6H088_9BACT|nr:nicotinate-nucleotide--dimethylbenzimidazole phosphoribosyltransferase [Sunxiuqinia elliptica]TDO01194.1 nicotinate-nucleotide-dimethylbenzimidazole phosphoribosyltransferase [Sunxiuqinia elliptica]TDO57705.1 nicotinate-nucleotide-dimethylbenzimidazole phosphoribosyltransferase [Sunxiuqinia elliptica]